MYIWLKTENLCSGKQLYCFIMAVFTCVPFLLSPVQLCFRRNLYPEGPGYMTTSP